jgi:apolipoprotein D and lipocalin family protein
MGYCEVMFKCPRRTSVMIAALLGILVLPLFSGCSSVAIPEGLQPVTNLDSTRYLGTWHEIARLENRFERGLSQITANYSLSDDQNIRVLNRGYNAEKGKWEEAEGIAKFLGDRSVGSLKVSFFRPFYGGYHIIALDQENYEYSMVSGPDRSYLWILAREPQLPEATLTRLLEQAHSSGFDTNALVFP